MFFSFLLLLLLLRELAIFVRFIYKKIFVVVVLLELPDASLGYFVQALVVFIIDILRFFVLGEHCFLRSSFLFILIIIFLLFFFLFGLSLYWVLIFIEFILYFSCSHISSLYILFIFNLDQRLLKFLSVALLLFLIVRLKENLVFFQDVKPLCLEKRGIFQNVLHTHHVLKRLLGIELSFDD